MKKRIIKKLISLALALTISSSLLMVPAMAESTVRYFLNESFEQAERPATLNYHDGSGNIHIETIGSTKALFLQNDSDGSYTFVTKSFSSVSEGVLTCEVKFLQPDVKSDGNIILEVLGNGSPALSIVTNDGNISAKRADGTYAALVNNYYTDKWYSLKVEADLQSGLCSFYVGGVLTQTNIAFLNNNGSVDTVSSYARFSPGFYIDDFKVSGLTDFASLTLTGPSTAIIPAAGENKYSFNAKLLSENQTVITGETLVWSIEGATTGVRIVPSSDTTSAELFVSPASLNSQTVTVIVKSSGGDLEDRINVTLETEAATKIVIYGDARVSTYDGKPVEFKYSAKIFDQLDNEITGETFKWEITNNSCATAQIDQNTGVLTVSGSMPASDENIIITAKLVSDETVYGQKSVLVQKYNIYYSDKQRFEAAIHSIDNVLKAASNPDGRNPLMGFYISPYTHTYGYWDLEGPKNPTANSNLSEQFQMMRAMVGISNMTGDESYRQRVMDIYQWYLDHAISTNGLVYWGNHQAMDLETGEWAEYYEKYATSQPYVEVKDRDVYMDPFVELDPQKAENILRDHWCAIINDWGYLNFNRHAIIKNGTAPNYAGWNSAGTPNDTYIELPADDPWVKSQDLCFSSSCASMLNMAQQLYKYFGDEKALLWAKRLIYRYINTRNPETKIFGTLFTTPMGAEGVYSLEETFGPTWWATQAGREAARSVAYGDRAYNQYAQTLADLGLITPERAKKEIKEGAYLFGNSTICDNIFIDSMYLGQTMIEIGTQNNDTTLAEEGRQLIRDYITGVAGYIRLGYDPEQNIFHKMFTNGIIMDDIVWTRPGYWGSAGKTAGHDAVQDYHANNFIQAYLMTENVTGIDAERETLWECARNICDKKYHIGDIGNPNRGIDPELNMGTNTTDPMVIRMLLRLYESSGNKEYLALARVVGNNILSRVYRNGYFIPNANLQYIDTDAEYAYVLLLLEAYLRGDKTLIPESRYQSHLEGDAVFRDDRNALENWSGTDLKTKTFPDVYVVEIRLDKTQLELEVGQSEKMGVTIRPDDATSKAIFWDIKDKDIVSVTSDNTFIAQKEGTTVAYAVSRGTANMVSKPVYITVKAKEE